MMAIIIPVKGIVVARVADLTVRIMCVVPGPLIIGPCVTASFAVPIVNAIMWSPRNVNRSNLLQVPSQVHGRSQPTPQVWVRQMSRVSRMGVHQ